MVGATLREGDAAFTLSGKLFLSGAGLLTGVLASSGLIQEKGALEVGCSLLGLQLGTYQGVISRGKWDRHAAVPEKGRGPGTDFCFSTKDRGDVPIVLFQHRGQSSEQQAQWIHPNNLWCK